MSAHFVKLYGSILDSTVWLEKSGTRILWITMLAMADDAGFVMASVPGLAKRAGVTREECETGLDVLLAPDRDSRTPAHEGRRVEKVEGGWLILNHRKYRDLRTDAQIATAERVRKHREKHRGDVTVTDVTACNAPKRTEVEGTEVTELTEKTTTSAVADIANLSEGKKSKAEGDYAFMGELRPTWQESYGGEIPPGSAKRLKPSVDKHGAEEVSRRLRIYCQATPAPYASIPKFIATFGAWEKAGEISTGLSASQEATIDQILEACNKAGVFSAINTKDLEQRCAQLAEGAEFSADELAAVGRINLAFCHGASQRNDRSGLKRHLASLVFFAPAPEQPRKHRPGRRNSPPEYDYSQPTNSLEGVKWQTENSTDIGHSIDKGIVSW